MAERRSGNSKLKVEGQTIVVDSAFVTGPIEVRFKKAALSPTGEIGRVTIMREGQTVELSFPQALSLAKVIMTKCEEKV